MPRPRVNRHISFKPDATYFKPAGVPLVELQELMLTFDELESIRLKDLLGLDQVKAAEKMNISQPTFNRLVSSARKKIADALINGRAIRIEGGNYKMVGVLGRGSGRMRGYGMGPGGFCKCPKCGYQEPQVRGHPCMNKKCIKCGAQMIRGGI